MKTIRLEKRSFCLGRTLIGRLDRAKDLFTRLFTAEACVGLVSLLIVELFPQPMIAIFGAAHESVYYTDFAVRSFRIYLCMLIFACINKAAFIFLQSMGRPWMSTFLSMLVSDVLTFAVSVLVIASTYRTLNQNEGRY